MISVAFFKRQKTTVYANNDEDFFFYKGVIKTFAE